jgi:hypothetical protein
MGDRSTEILADLHDWMARKNATIMAVICLIIRAKLIGDAIVTLSWSILCRRASRIRRTQAAELEQRPQRGLALLGLDLRPDLGVVLSITRSG